MADQLWFLDSNQWQTRFWSLQSNGIFRFLTHVLLSVIPFFPVGYTNVLKNSINYGTALPWWYPVGHQSNCNATMTASALFIGIEMEERFSSNSPSMWRKCKNHCEGFPADFWCDSNACDVLTLSAEGLAEIWGSFLSWDPQIIPPRNVLAECCSVAWDWTALMLISMCRVTQPWGLTLKTTMEY
jgi:hypothetical protein